MSLRRNSEDESGNCRQLLELDHQQYSGKSFRQTGKHHGQPSKTGNEWSSWNIRKKIQQQLNFDQRPRAILLASQCPKKSISQESAVRAAQVPVGC